MCLSYFVNTSSVEITEKVSGIVDFCADLEAIKLFVVVPLQPIKNIAKSTMDNINDFFS